MREEICELFEKNIALLSSSFSEAMSNVFREYKCLQDCGRKGELANVYISLLLSGVICKSEWFHIGLYDEKNMNDVTECSVLWGVDVIARGFYEYIDDLCSKLGRTERYNKSEMLIEEISKLIPIIECFLIEIIGSNGFDFAKGCRWHFGEYLGGTELIWRTSE